MIHATPSLTPAILTKVARLDELRRRLFAETRRPSRWFGSLRRVVRAQAVEGSTSIEGFTVPMEEAVALLDHSAMAGADDNSAQAVACYGQAMDHVDTMADDPEFEWSKRVILDLQFEACYFQADKRPGLWRTGPVYVTGRGGRIIYTAPPADEVPALMEEVANWLKSADPETHSVVRAAMAHLHVVSVHPFRDGNGRTARIVQSLVLARDRLLPPEFASIEEWLGEHTGEYYDALNRAHGPDYNPVQDASDWVDFCIQAHLEQAERRLRQFDEAGKRWGALEALVERKAWPDRLVIALERSLTGYLDRAGYMQEAEISLATANLDLRRLVDAGQIVLERRGRTARYVAAPALKDLISAVP